jgi:hypothetical protein
LHGGNHGNHSPLAGTEGVHITRCLFDAPGGNGVVLSNYNRYGSQRGMLASRFH